MSDRYIGDIICPHCNEETEFIYADGWGENQTCDECGKKFIIELNFTAVKPKTLSD